MTKAFSFKAVTFIVVAMMCASVSAEVIEGTMDGVDTNARTVTVRRVGKFITLKYRLSSEAFLNGQRIEIGKLKPELRVKVDSREPGTATIIQATGSRTYEPPASLGAVSININTANAKQLRGLPEVGEDLARKIVKGRPYEKPEDLLRVSGIKQKTLETLLPHLKF